MKILKKALEKSNAAEDLLYRKVPRLEPAVSGEPRAAAGESAPERPTAPLAAQAVPSEGGHPQTEAASLPVDETPAGNGRDADAETVQPLHVAGPERVAAETTPGGSSRPCNPCMVVNPTYHLTKRCLPDTAHLERNRILGGITDPKVADIYSLIRTKILEMTGKSGANTIMITSARPGEGKTVTAINLALSMARDVQRTALLVDMNLRRPMVTAAFGLNGQFAHGVADYLLHDTPVEDMLVHPQMDKVVLLPAGRPLPGSTEVLASPKMERLVVELKSRYPDRYVIFDCPHLLGMSDSFVFSSYVDGVVLVVEAGRTSRSDIKAALDLLAERNLIGMVVNKGRADA